MFFDRLFRVKTRAFDNNTKFIDEADVLNTLILRSDFSDEVQQPQKKTVRPVDRGGRKSVIPTLQTSSLRDRRKGYPQQYVVGESTNVEKSMTFQMMTVRMMLKVVKLDTILFQFIRLILLFWKCINSKRINLIFPTFLHNPTDVMRE